MENIKDKKNLSIIGIIAVIAVIIVGVFVFNQYSGGAEDSQETAVDATDIDNKLVVVITPSAGFDEVLSFVSNGEDFTLGPIPGHYWKQDSDTTLLAEHYNGSEPFPWASDVTADTLLYEAEGILGTCSNGYNVDKPDEDGFVHFHGSNEDSDTGFWLKHTAVTAFTWQGPPGNPDIGRNVPIGVDPLFPNICEFPAEAQGHGVSEGDDSDEDTLGAADSGVVEIELTAKQWEFSPKVVTVKQGDTVKMTITSLDVAHGFAINELGVSETIPAGETVSFEFVADKKGTYRHYCNVVCGTGHASMVGEFIVE